MPEENKVNSDLPKIRTMQSDAADYASRPKSLGEALKSQIKRREDEGPEPREGKKIWILIAGVLVFLALAGGGIWTYLNYKSSPDDEIAPSRPKKLIAGEENIIEISRLEDFSEEVKRALSQKPASGSFKIFLFSVKSGDGSQFISLAQFLELSKLNPPPRLRSNLEAYSLGLFNSGGVWAPFLIFKAGSFENSFAGILLWEKAMPSELSIFFPELENVNELEVFFQDRIVKNLDARMFSRNAGSELWYAFFNKNLLIITSSQKSLEEILSRYAIFGPN